MRGKRMGFLRQMSSGLHKTSNPMEGRARWREVFVTHKEDEKKKPGAWAPQQGGSFAASSVTGAAALKRLVAALRSRAPGGWSDDRWEQTMRHFVGVPYIAIHRIGMHLSRAEFQVYQKDDKHQDGMRPVKPDDPPQGDRMCKPHDLVTILEKPNPLDSFGDLMYRWCQQKFLTGSALTFMVPNKLHYPMELYSIPTAMAIPQATVTPDYPEGYYRIQPVYPYGPFSTYPSPNTSVGAAVDARWMFKFQYPHPLLRYEGYAPQTGMRLQLDTLDSIDRSRWYGMKRSVNFSGVLDMSEIEGVDSLNDDEIERLQTMWEEFQGPEAHGGLFIPPPGGKLDQFGQRPIDMDWQSGFDQLASLVLGGFGITKPAAGMVEDTNYSILFATLKQLYMVTLEPECDDIAAKLTRFLAPYFGDNLIIRIRAKPINDHEITMQKIDKGTQCKCMTKNEVRKALDMPVTMDAWGDEIAGTEKVEEPPPGMAGGMPGMPMEMPQGAPQAAPGAPQEQPVGPDGQPVEGEAGGPGEAAAPTGDIDAEIDALLEEELAIGEAEGEQGRPKTGPIGEGSLGPYKSYLQLHNRMKPQPAKSWYEWTREVCEHGTGKSFLGLHRTGSMPSRLTRRKSWYDWTREVCANGH